MNQEEIQQAALDQALVPTDDQFQLDDQKFEVDVELFWKILRICPRFPNKEFIEPHPHDSLVIFINQLGYKGSLDLISDILSDISCLIYCTKPPKKGRGKGKCEKKMKATATPTKKGSLFAEENILSNPDESLELGVSISKTEAEIANEERRLYETHVKTIAQELLNLKKGIKKAEKTIFYNRFLKAQVKDLVLNQSDDERTESEREVAETNNADDETTDDEEVHHEEKVHEDEEMHDVDEIHVDDEETSEEIVDAEKVDTEKIEYDKVDNEQAGADQAAKDYQA
uniref:Uncharacterized protein n=1 Tax=Tanacetum cinerariifolium TaxID=118510 RepID=A0A6L2MAI7_TANCI|nr:hypothetical protein [Tanacetum cinerariifolium]